MQLNGGNRLVSSVQVPVASLTRGVEDRLSVSVRGMVRRKSTRRDRPVVLSRLEVSNDARMADTLRIGRRQVHTGLTIPVLAAGGRSC